MNLNEEITSLYERLESLPDEKIPTWNEFVDSLREWLPIDAGEPFTFTSEAVGDPHAVFYDDEGQSTWTKVSYSIDFQYDENGLQLIVNAGDIDGNWDAIISGGEEEFHSIYTYYISPRLYFISWAEYHLWCAENDGVDPLEEYYRLEDSTVESHLKEARSMIEYAEKEHLVG